MNKACFLDRDGVLIEEKEYLDSADQVILIDGAIDAIKLLKESGYLVVVVSNQSGVARGYFKENSILKVNRRITELLSKDHLYIDAFYHCPHHEKGSIPKYTISCNCRKPKPGMLLKAAEDLSIDLQSSFMIGDKISDIGAAINAKCGDAFLVKTGHGKKQISENDTANIKIADNIKEAVKLHIGKQ